MKELGRRLLTFVCVMVVLFIVYTVICACLGKDTFYPNTSINGIDVSKMTVAEAAEAVSEQFAKEYSAVSIAVAVEDNTCSVDVTEALNLDVTDAVQAAMDESGKFFSRGINYIASLFGSKEYEASPSLADKEVLYTSISNSNLSSFISASEKGYQQVGDTIVITKGRGGYIVDEDALVELLATAVDAADFSTTIECPITYGDVDIAQIYDEIYTEPQDASIVTDESAENGYTITQAVDGISFDLDAAQSAYDAAADGDAVTISLVYTSAEITAEELESCIFRDVLGCWSTTVTGTSNRKTNVRLASEKINGTIIPSGGQFSYNEVVGQRTLANGFLEAPAYSNGDSVDEVGGGICQVSTTLYIAALYANLQIDQRTNHSYPSTYASLGLDATVSWGGPEFIFTNDTDYPIKVVSSYGDDGKVYVYIYGTKTTEFKVELKTETVATYEYETVYEDDDTLPEGEEEVETSGHTGYKVISYRIVYDGDGNVISNEQEAVSTYKKQNRVIKVGTGDSEDDDEDEDETSSSKKKKKKKKSTTEDTTTEATTEATTQATTTEATTQAATESTTAEAATEAVTEAAQVESTE